MRSLQHTALLTVLYGIKSGIFCASLVLEGIDFFFKPDLQHTSNQVDQTAVAAMGRVLPDTCWQHGVAQGDIPLYYLMEKALLDFPSLKQFVAGIGHSHVAATKQTRRPSALIRLRDSVVGGVMTAAAAGYLPGISSVLHSLTLPSAPAGVQCDSALWHNTPAFDRSPRFGFAGASWMIMYHIGVASALRERWDLTRPATKLAGTSSGSMLAMALGSGVPLSTLLNRAIDQAKVCERRVLGPLGVMSEVSLGGAHTYLPSDASQRLSGRLRVSVTQALPCDTCGPAAASWAALRRRHVTHWRSNDELLDTCLASSHIPGYFERPIVLRPGHAHRRVVQDTQQEEERAEPCGECSAPGNLGCLCWDGGLTDNIPRWDPSEVDILKQGVMPAHEQCIFTATVSPEVQAGTISPPPAAAAGGMCRLAWSPDTAQPFAVDPRLGAGGWPKWYSLVPPTEELYWQVFFAGRGHAQEWMRRQQLLPRGRPQPHAAEVRAASD